MLVKISRANAVHMTSLTKRNITGITGCQLGLLIPNWTHSDWQLCLAGLYTGVFPLLAAIFPQEDKARPPPASLGTRSVLGARGDAEENFYAAKQHSGLQLLKKFPLSAKPFKLPKHFGNYSISFCCQLGNLFHCINCRKREHTFAGEGYFVSLLSKCRVRRWAKLCGVSLRTPHEGPISKGSTSTLLHFCLGWTPTLVPTIELWLVSPTHSSHFSWISVLPSVLLMQWHQEIQLLCGLEGP